MNNLHMAKWAILVMSLLVIPLLTGYGLADDRLHKAAHRGDIDAVRTLLEDKPDPDERDSFGGTALHAAMFQDNMEIVELLLNGGLDPNARGSSNGYTPLHDAVWADNLEAAKLLIEHGARIDIKADDGLTPLEKAQQDNKQEIAAYLESQNQKIYSPDARNNYSENDVKAFVYKWFAGFDHQADPDYFLAHLDPDHVDMHFPDFPIKSIQDFLNWYQGVIDNIGWNSHGISNLVVDGSEKDGFSVSLDIHWQARTYDNQEYDVNVHQDWQVSIDKDRQFIISKHRAELL